RAGPAMATAVNRTAIIPNSPASGVIPPANEVAAPIDRAVATAGAVWVIDWHRTLGSPIAPRSRHAVGPAPPPGRSLTVPPDPPFTCPDRLEVLGRRTWGESAGNRMRWTRVGEEGS